MYIKPWYFEQVIVLCAYVLSKWKVILFYIKLKILVFLKEYLTTFLYQFVSLMNFTRSLALQIVPSISEICKPREQIPNPWERIPEPRLGLHSPL